jgi:hypothetical protein
MPGFWNYVRSLAVWPSWSCMNKHRDINQDDIEAARKAYSAILHSNERLNGIPEGTIVVSTFFESSPPSPDYVLELKW